jgi:hypothetical protein
MKGLSTAWFRANAAKVIDIGLARKKRKRSQRDAEEDEQRDIRARVIERAESLFPSKEAAYGAAFVGIKDRLLSLGFSVRYANEAARWLAVDYEAGVDRPTFHEDD